jgi:oxalate---CoA ligase
MVYTALQFITRGREHGISIVELGKKTGYDQKTCFYLIKQLLELELVLKLRRGGVGTNFCIHKHFFERSPLWRQMSLTPDGFQAPLRFDPIDARHLSSLSLVQSRIVKLLKHSEFHTHPSQNLLVAIVSKNPLDLTRKISI